MGQLFINAKGKVRVLREIRATYDAHMTDGELDVECMDASVDFAAAMLVGAHKGPEHRRLLKNHRQELTKLVEEAVYTSG